MKSIHRKTHLSVYVRQAAAWITLLLVLPSCVAPISSLSGSRLGTPATVAGALPSASPQASASPKASPSVLGSPLNPGSSASPSPSPSVKPSAGLIPSGDQPVCVQTLQCIVSASSTSNSLRRQTQDVLDQLFSLAEPDYTQVCQTRSQELVAQAPVCGPQPSASAKPLK